MKKALHQKKSLNFGARFCYDIRLISKKEKNWKQKSNFWMT